MSTYTHAPGERHLSRGLKRRLIGFFTVLLMAFGLSGLTVLPAAATDAGDQPDQEETDSPEATEEEEEAEEEHDDAAEPESEESEDAAADADPAESAAEPEAEPEESSQEEPVAAAAEVVVEEAPAEQAADEEALAVADDEPVIEEGLVAEETPVEDADVETEEVPATEESEAAAEAVEDTSESDVSEVDTLETQEEEAGSTWDVEWEMDPILRFDSARELSEWLMARNGVEVSGWEFPEGTEVTASVGTQVIDTATADSRNAVEFRLVAELAPGIHTITLSSEEASVSGDIQVIADGDYYEPELTFDYLPETSEWLMAREGVAVTGWPFPSDAEVAVTVGSQTVGTTFANEYGEVLGFTVIAALAPGVHTITLSAESVSASAELEVIADEDYYPVEEYAPELRVSKPVVATISDVEAGDLRLQPIGFGGPADLYLNGELYAESIDSSGMYEFVLSDIGPGEYTALLRMGPIEAEVSFLVVPDEQGEPPVSGTYLGESVTRDGDSIPLTLEVDENGVLTTFYAPRGYACVSHDGAVIEPMEFGWGTLPPTPITVDQPFEISWGGPSVTTWQSQRVSGVINADGTASGIAVWDNGCRGGIYDEWTAQIDGVLPDPEPTPDPTEEPEPTPDPTTDPEPTDEPEPTQDPTTDPEPTDEPDPSEDPTEEPTTEPTDPAPTEEPTQEPTEEPTSEPTSDPTSEPTEDPTADPTEEPTTGGIEAPAEAVVGSDITITVGEDHADQQVSVWLHSDPIHLGDPTVGADGTVTVSLPDGVTGEHTLRVYTAEGSLIGEAPITITTADTGTGNDDDEDDGESGTGGGSDTDDGPGTSGGDSTDTDSEETTSGESTSGGSTDDSGSTDGGLAATGTTVAALVALGAGLLMLLGVGVLTISRRRAAE